MSNKETQQILELIKEVLLKINNEEDEQKKEKLYENLENLHNVLEIMNPEIYNNGHE